MAKTHLVDEMAAFTLFEAAIKQARKDLRYKTVKAQDRYTAAKFLEDMRHGDERRNVGRALPIRPR